VLWHWHANSFEIGPAAINNNWHPNSFVIGPAVINNKQLAMGLLDTQ
jgi:hypothetical protein